MLCGRRLGRCSLRTSGKSPGVQGTVRRVVCPGRSVGAFRRCLVLRRLRRFLRSVLLQLGRAGCGLGGGFWRGCRISWRGVSAD